jgi:DNA repair protein RecO (recombination protein O)
METDVIVLECNDHGESDVIVTLFSRDNGRMTAIAKGAKKSLKRFVNKLEIFSFLHVVCQRKTPASLALLAEADLHCAFFNIRHHLELYVVATVIREFLLIAIKDGEPDEHIFQLSLWAFHQLDQNHTPRTILALFLIRFFEYVGYRPNLDNCGRCQGQVSTSGPLNFLPEAGTLFCSHCLAPATPMSSLSQGTLKMLRTAQNLPLQRLDRLRLSEPLQQESLSMLHAYGKSLFQRDIVSWRHLWRQPRRRS